MNKELIKKRFKRGLKTYDKNAIVQKKMAENLIKLIDENTEVDSILEIGCGTGVLTDKIIKKIKFKNYTAIDIVDCSEYMKNISDKIEFIETDAEKYQTDKKYDIIISNASIQWIADLENFVKKIKAFLNKNGIIYFTTFGEKNFEEFAELVKTPLRYYTTDELKKILSGFKKTEIKETIEKIEFKTPLNILQHIKKTGVNGLSETRWTKKDLIEFEEKYPKNENGEYTLTYHPVYIKAGQ